MSKSALAFVQPRGLSREVAAHYVGISARGFDALVDEGRMPRAKRIGSRKVWDRLEIDEAMEALPVDGEACGNSWDGV